MIISALACLVFVAILITCIPKDWSYLDVKEEQTEEKETVSIVCWYILRFLIHCDHDYSDLVAVACS